jgi:hypothetical protein
VRDPLRYVLHWPGPLPCGCRAETITLIVDRVEGGEPGPAPEVESNVPELADDIVEGIAHGEWPCECQGCGAVFDEHELGQSFDDGQGVLEECPF